MTDALSRADPTPVIAHNLLQGSGGTGTYYAVLSVRIPFNATSTANAAVNWINPESGTVAAKATVVFTTAGTGTFDMGRSSDGTGSNDNLVDGGTLAAGVHYVQEILGTVAASATVGGVDKLWMLIGPGGTGTNNSIVLKHSDTTASTAVGAMCVTYFRVA